ncbi:type II secretion system protein [Mitsuaria sp. WAJ17]|uniref:PulJ/GspJ family protein n=1 Tax=Mitsuaria sp. WAJ17 TaxID=2761452 RepID=UPI001603FEF6|nr:type II secretion system protein [Mitsuaria sp. WAJ17]MBB2486424.1 type II secretion system protein [Mitsuaria sp. WAJ17]
MRAERHPAAGQRGFTLIEAVMVIVVMGGIIAGVSVFIAPAIRGYLDSAARADLAARTDLALRRIARDLAESLPNSVRINAAGTTLELVPTTGAARYQTEGAGALVFGTPAASFKLVGPGLAMEASQQLVWYNLGVNVPDANAYAGISSASNRRIASNAAGTATTINLASNPGLPVSLMAPPYRVYAVSSPITYRCDPTARTLTRYSGYGFQPALPDPPTGGSSALLAEGVKSCNFVYEAAVVAYRAGTVNLRLELQADTVLGNESVQLFRAVHVENLP